MKTIYQVFVALLIVIFQINSFAGKEGGGGGFVHDKFIAAGYRVLYYLMYTEPGQQLVDLYKLNICRLSHTIRNDGVYVDAVTNGAYMDHRGSVVDAYTFPWQITLVEESWSYKFKDTKFDEYNLVFKEMLRAEVTQSKISDRISISLKPFPERLGLQTPTYNIHNWSEFLLQVEHLQKTCLSEADKNNILQVDDSSAKNILMTGTPACLSRDFQEEPYEMLGDALIRHVAYTGCELRPSPCTVLTQSTYTPNGSITTETIYWRGNVLFVVPIAQYNIYNKITSPIILKKSRGTTDELLGRLRQSGICSQSL